MKNMKEEATRNTRRLKTQKRSNEKQQRDIEKLQRDHEKLDGTKTTRGEKLKKRKVEVQELRVGNNRLCSTIRRVKSKGGGRGYESPGEASEGKNEPMYVYTDMDIYHV